MPSALSYKVSVSGPGHGAGTRRLFLNVCCCTCLLKRTHADEPELLRSQNDVMCLVEHCADLLLGIDGSGEQIDPLFELAAPVFTLGATVNRLYAAAAASSAPDTEVWRNPLNTLRRKFLHCIDFVGSHSESPEHLKQECCAFLRCAATAAHASPGTPSATLTMSANSLQRALRSGSFMGRQ